MLPSPNQYSSRCSGKSCLRFAEFVCKYVRNDKRGYVIPCNRLACRRHAEAFARKFGLSLPGKEASA